jgi:UDP-glucose/GDP-mannose dehydrogenase family, central domain
VRNANTLVVGLGEVGGALSQVLRRTGRVLEHDIERCEFDEPIGVMHLCIPFKRQADFEATALSYIQRFKPELTIINSTVVPGTSRAIAERAKSPIAYSPVRGKHIRMAEDLLRYRKFVAGSDDNAASRAAEHFRAAGMTTQCISKLETLELAKLGETTYFGVLIAFAQELNRYANRVDGDYAEALDFFEEVDFLPNTKYFPGFIGGHCVIPNIDLMRTIASSPMLEAVLESNRLRVEELTNEARIVLSPDPKLNPVPPKSKSAGDAPLSFARR